MRQANLRPPSRSQKPPKRKAAASKPKLKDKPAKAARTLTRSSPSSGRKAPAAEPAPAHKIAATTKKAS